LTAKATIFDGGEATKDRNGLLFSEKWAADEHGEWCYGTVSFVYARRGRYAQLYRVSTMRDEGTVMQAEDAHLEIAQDEDDSDEESDNEMGGSEAENSNDETVYEQEFGGFRI
jgi:hypothetical protein